MGKTITDPKEIVNFFNRYYASVADEILQERKYEGKSHTEYLLEDITKLQNCLLVHDYMNNTLPSKLLFQTKPRELQYANEKLKLRLSLCTK